MSADKYRYAEEQFAQLRGQFDAGALDQVAFDDKLRELMVQDEQGRYWMLGAESGKWYYYDGAKWVQGAPYPGASAEAKVGAEFMPPTTSAPPPVMPLPMDAAGTPPPGTVPPARVTAPPARPAAAMPATPRPAPTAAKAGPTRTIPLSALVLALVLIALAGGAFLVFSNRDRFAATSSAQITPVVPPTITREPSPTPVLSLPTAGLPTLAAAAIPTSPAIATVVPPPTLAPASATVELAQPTAQATATVAAPTSAGPTTGPATLIPTVTPLGATGTPVPVTVTAVGTAATTAVASTTTAPNATATTAPVTNTPAFTFPPGVYVTAIAVEPSAPKRANPVQFTATFVNTTGSAQGYNWIIQVYDPNKTGANKRFGESNTASITVPPGTSQFTVTYPGVSGKGGCVPLYAQAEWVGSDTSRTPFEDGHGVIVQRPFDVCP